MRRASMVLLLFVIVVAAAVAQAPMTLNIGNIRIGVPQGWVVENTQTNVLFIMYAPAEANDDFNENANLSVEQLPRSYSVDEYREATAVSLEQIFSNLNITEQRDNWHVYSASTSGIQIAQIQYFHIEDQVAYTLTFTSSPGSFKRYRRQFEQIASTLAFE